MRERATLLDSSQFPHTFVKDDHSNGHRHRFPPPFFQEIQSRLQAREENRRGEIAGACQIIIEILTEVFDEKRQAGLLLRQP